MRQVMIPAVATLVTVLAMAYQAKTIDPVLCEAPEVRLVEVPGYSSVEEEAAESELRKLPNDTMFVKRSYTGEDGSWYHVEAVIGGRSKSSIHRPELCLPSQGFQMMDPHTLTAGEWQWHRVSLMRKGARPYGFAYTFFNQTGFKTSSHVRRIIRDVWDRSILGRVDRWVMITVYSSENDDERLAKFLEVISLGFGVPGT